MSEPTKSPVKDKPLRLPGRSLGAVRRTLFEDRLETPFVLALFSCVVLGIVWRLQAHADQPVYRCAVNGQTTYTDRPCDGRTLPAVPGPINPPSNQSGSNNGSPSKTIEPDYKTPYGIWRGQAQYQASMKGQVIRDAHAVVPLVIQVEDQGRVRGFSTENGCTMLGVAAPYATPMALMLDVTLSECHYPYFNKRYSGSLVLSQADSQAHLSLQSTNLGGVGNGGDYFDLKATLRR